MAWSVRVVFARACDCPAVYSGSGGGIELCHDA